MDLSALHAFTFDLESMQSPASQQNTTRTESVCRNSLHNFVPASAASFYVVGIEHLSNIFYNFCPFMTNIGKCKIDS